MTDFNYSKENIGIIEQGEYRGRYYIIAVNGMPLHPCAYVSSCTDDNKELIGKFVHGGITWNNLGLYQYSKEGKILNSSYALVPYWGWDYGHASDYSTVTPEGDKHTLEEVRQDVFALINLIKVYNELVNNL